MNKLTCDAFQEISDWMHRNARSIELALWRYRFEGGNKDEVLAALSYYQNKDGGFGHALEPDCWNPNSSPYTTLYAIRLLRGIGFTHLQHRVFQGILKYLTSGEHITDYGWPFTIPSNDHYPHAPWWTYNADSNSYESIGVTAELCGFVLRYAARNEEIYRKALDYTDALIKILKQPTNLGDMGVQGYCALLADLEHAEPACRFDCDFLQKRLKKLVARSIERDIAKWPHYNAKPSEYIKSPDSIFYPGNEEIVSAELDYILDSRHPGGVWDIAWSWFEHNEKYPKEFAVSENWWKAIKAIEQVQFLKNFDRME
ncbi:hypothetical protein V3851_08040 [Paenibacillus sp. M1]|uniref:Uncharacterized protein n=1 Tax=Paenibacillus haidiansis TaxID=1574488 RepID=A0ABU7VRE5_9BACL